MFMAHILTWLAGVYELEDMVMKLALNAGNAVNHYTILIAMITPLTPMGKGRIKFFPFFFLEI